jgi:hypothetical protein
MYTTIYAKVRINAGAHGKIMSNIGVKQGLPPYPTLFGMYIDELEKYLDEIDGDSPCLFDMVVIILLYANDVDLLLMSRACLQDF